MERRRRPDRRQSPGRRAVDYEARASPLTFVWAACGALVVLYLFFVAIGGVNPREDPGWGIAALVLALIWLAHSWRRLWAGGASPAPDRERRGF
jgi:uncharacterized membrane protein YdbT with pleckstrin-like domain